MPNFCMPMKGGPVGKDGMECPVTCPMKCGFEEMPCYDGYDHNGCQKPEFCIPMKGGPLDNDGMECPVQCPVKCLGDDIYCPSGHDFNGCEVPGNCMPFDFECPGGI
jgi:hypothetical protein